MTPRIRTAMGWSLFGLVIVGIGLLCWNQIARDLASPLTVTLGVSGNHAGFPKPQGGPATVRWYGVDNVDVELTHISPTLQWMLSLDTVLKFLLVAAGLLVVGVIWFRLSSGRVFAPAVTRSLVGMAALVAVDGAAIEILENFINNREVFEILGNHVDGDYFSASAQFQFTGVELFIAVPIAILASAFAIGARISRDTEGLV
jgi:hypothetical protein